MSQIAEQIEVVDVEAHVRQRAGACALTASLLLFFGFFVFGSAVGSELFLSGHWIFLISLRTGGLLLVGAAVACCLGTGYALLAEGVVAALAGLGILLGGAIMLAAAGPTFQTAICIIVGLMMVVSGLRIFFDFATLPGEDTEMASADEGADALQSLGELRNVAQAAQGSVARVVDPEDSQMPEPIVFDKPGGDRSKRPGHRHVGLRTDDEDVIHLDDFGSKGRGASDRAGPDRP